MTFDVKIYPKVFPTVEISIESFYEYYTISKQFNWMYIPTDYFLRPDNLDTKLHALNVMRVNIISAKVEHNNGRKSINLTLQRIY